MLSHVDSAPDLSGPLVDQGEVAEESKPVRGDDAWRSFLCPVSGGLSSLPDVLYGWLSRSCAACGSYSTFPVMIDIFNSPIALVIWMSRGQAIVQLNTV